MAHPVKEERADQEIVIDFCNIQTDALEHVQKYLNNSNLFNESVYDYNVFSLSEDGNNKLIPCDSFEHNAVYTSIITQFDLYCSKEILIAVTQFFHLFGEYPRIFLFF
jgi:hypothetical protein